MPTTLSQPGGRFQPFTPNAENAERERRERPEPAASPLPVGSGVLSLGRHLEGSCERTLGHPASCAAGPIRRKARQRARTELIPAAPPAPPAFPPANNSRRRAGTDPSRHAA